MSSRVSYIASLLLAAVLPCTFTATGEDDGSPLAPRADWVASREAGYCDGGGKVTGELVAGTRHVELAAKELPESGLTILRTRAEWDDFAGRFAQTDGESGKPAFFSGSGFFATPERVRFDPEFESDAVLVVTADEALKGRAGAFMDIEVFDDGDRTRAFVFFAPAPAGPAVGGDARDKPSAGHLYMVSIPRELADRPVEVRVARQSWGRACARFSPAITHADAAGSQPTKRADKGRSKE